MTKNIRNIIWKRLKRMHGWDYVWNGKYFITICTGGRECCFADIIDDQLILSETGIIAKKLWLAIPDHFDYVTLDAYVIMPDHMHGIVLINNGYTVHNTKFKY